MSARLEIDSTSGHVVGIFGEIHLVDYSITLIERVTMSRQKTDWDEGQGCQEAKEELRRLVSEDEGRQPLGALGKSYLRVGLALTCCSFVYNTPQLSGDDLWLYDSSIARA